MKLSWASTSPGQSCSPHWAVAAQQEALGGQSGRHWRGHGVASGMPSLQPWGWGTLILHLIPAALSWGPHPTHDILPIFRCSLQTLHPTAGVIPTPPRPAGSKPDYPQGRAPAKAGGQPHLQNGRRRCSPNRPLWTPAFLQSPSCLLTPRGRRTGPGSAPLASWGQGGEGRLDVTSAGTHALYLRPRG